VSDGNAEQERLLAEALRAQAVRAPLPDPARRPDEPALPLYSGQDALLSGRASDTMHLPPVGAPLAGRVPPPAPSGQLAAGWIVLLAVLLGLAAGAVVGLVSIL
jgi:hypothetical protein